jgi:hypothetical protein
VTAARTVLLLSVSIVFLASCGPLLRALGLSDERDWYGLTIGKTPPASAIAETTLPGGPPSYEVQLTGSRFPWQQETARLSQDGRVMAVTLSTGCCLPFPESLVSLSDEDMREMARLAASVPDRFRDGEGPPQLEQSREMLQIRVISARDMGRYAEAALRTVSQKLGRPNSTSWKNAPEWSPMTDPLSKESRLFEARWTRNGAYGAETIAILDSSPSRICFSAVAVGIPHPRLESACEGVDLTCFFDWYPSEKTRLRERLARGEFVPPSAPEPGEERCRSRG